MCRDRHCTLWLLGLNPDHVVLGHECHNAQINASTKKRKLAIMFLVNLAHIRGVIAFGRLRGLLGS